jgi:2-(1,2-epoxy-1,2-dihydrophenyl)acetyl-CoA isomerase
MDYEVVELEFADDEHIATITLNRPATLNAVTRQMAAELRSALDEVADRFPDIRAVILTGAGRGFCSGADVKAIAEQIPNDGSDPYAERDWDDRNWDDPSNVPTLALCIQKMPQPVIAAVNGVAAGAGLSLACACDIRIASEAARFTAIFVKRGLVPDTGASGTVPRLVGAGIAAEMALTGRIYDAPWALQTGLVNDVVPVDQLMEAARSMASDIAGNPPLTVRSVKELMNNIDLFPALRDEAEANLKLFNSEDRREAVLSFLEKRQPVFKGR